MINLVRDSRRVRWRNALIKTASINSTPLELSIRRKSNMIIVVRRGSVLEPQTIGLSDQMLRLQETWQSWNGCKMITCLLTLSKQLLFPK